ncbi:MAG TPA: FtsX-like permease family protein [Aquihabitans sp.]|jgi:putative ABC transport system permease protein|nr:FtsX-like permease family protein [Aquihabitans sp.]
MFRTTLKNLAAHKLRLLTTSLAVLLGVAFMAGTLVLTDTIGKTFDGLISDINAGTSVHVRSDVTTENELTSAQRARVDTSLADTIARVDGVQAAEPYVEAYARLVDKEGDAMGNPDLGAPTVGGNWMTTPSLNPTDLVHGREPRAGDEVVIDKASADTAGFRVGDPVQVLTQAGTLDQTVVGIATFAGEDSPGGASYTMFTTEAALANLTQPGKADAIKVAATEGTGDAELAARIADVVPDDLQVLTGAEITAEDQASLRDEMSFFNTFLLVFALIALFVGSFIIYNSFSIIVAQRGKEMALLRAIGASRRQVLGSVLLESVAVGLVASVVGLFAGIGVASVLKALFEAVGVDIPAGSVVVTGNTVLVSMIAGFGVSVASALLPARRASRVPPIAAMRAVATDDSSSSRSRKVIGALLGVSGASALVAGTVGSSGLALVGLGALLVFVATLVLGPVLATPVSWLLGAPLPRLRGMSGTLARQNAMRSPKRTSATAAALMIGVTLVVFISILGASTKASVEASVEESFTGDLVVSSGAVGQAGGLPADLTDAVRRLPEVGAATGLRVAPAEVEGSGQPLYAADVQALQQIVEVDEHAGSFADLGSTRIAVDEQVAEDEGWEVGDAVTVAFADTGEQAFTIAALYEATPTLGQYFVDLSTFEANVADRFDNQVLVAFADSVGVDAGRTAIERVADGYPQAEVQDRAAYAAAQTEQMDMILSLIYALLGLAVLIALLGIANTLALSIFERTRELGLLRAVGMTRSQLRSAVRWEAVIIALLGTALGLGLGTLFGWSMVDGLRDEGLTTLSIPTTQLVVVTVVAALAGTAAAVLPARRASRLDVLGAIVSE